MKLHYNSIGTKGILITQLNTHLYVHDGNGNSVSIIDEMSSAEITQFHFLEM